MEVQITLFEEKLKLTKGNAWSCFGAKRALIGLATNKFAAGIRNSCNNLLVINSAKKTLDHSYYKVHPRQKVDNSKPWPGFLVDDPFIFGNNNIKIFLKRST